ncbi:hypothetical protein E2C01_084340 [Portunus trituberculatus]|uniref:Uncharacterized protein n=1 Tax=Portunus trituberculatus TaxID=210409 RepID=A0A5B7J3S3_PORTR|nr:hypothetical protein [Portunus trituberculatus]
MLYVQGSYITAEPCMLRIIATDVFSAKLQPDIPLHNMVFATQDMVIVASSQYFSSFFTCILRDKIDSS